jgi:hypothetical protein
MASGHSELPQQIPTQLATGPKEVWRGILKSTLRGEDLNKLDPEG